MHQQANKDSGGIMDDVEGGSQLTNEEKLLEELKTIKLELDTFIEEKKELEKKLAFSDRKRASLSVEVSELEIQVESYFEGKKLADAALKKERDELNAQMKRSSDLLKYIKELELKVKTMEKQQMEAQHSADVQLREAQFLAEQPKHSAEVKHLMNANVLAQTHAASPSSSFRELQLENDLAAEKRRREDQQDHFVQCFNMFRKLVNEDPVAAAFLQLNQAVQQTLGIVGAQHLPSTRIMEESRDMVARIAAYLEENHVEHQPSFQVSVPTPTRPSSPQTGRRDMEEAEPSSSTSNQDHGTSEELEGLKVQVEMALEPVNSEDEYSTPTESGEDDDDEAANHPVEENEKSSIKQHETMVKCQVCAKMIKSHLLQLHQECHMNICCDKCESRFTRFASLDSHLLSVTACPRAQARLARKKKYNLDN